MWDRKAEELSRLFMRIEARDSLSSEEKKDLIGAAGEVRKYAAGSDIVREGDRPIHSSLLLSGMATRYNVLRKGNRQISAVHVPGDFVDLHSFPLRKMDHAVGALSDCTIALFPHENLKRLTEHRPHLTRLLWMLTLLDGAIHRRWIVAMGRMSSKGHFAHFICETYSRLEDVGLAEDLKANFPITQLELSDVLGISAVHVNRVLQELRSAEIVRWEGRSVEILDWQALASLAEFDGEYLFRECMPR